MMSAEKIDAAPILASGPIDAEKPAQWWVYEYTQPMKKADPFLKSFNTLTCKEK